MANICFEQSDKKFSMISKLSSEIAEIATKNEILVNVLCQVILENSKLRINMRKEVSDDIDSHAYRIPEELLDDFVVMKNYLIEYFLITSDYEVKSQMRTENNFEFDNNFLRIDGTLLDYLRGNLLEVIVEFLVKDRYLSEEYMTGCIVKINKRLVSVGYTGEDGLFHNRKTIDFAGWSKLAKKGEFYECKCRPHSFKKSNFDYLVKLSSELVNARCASSLVGWVTADACQYALQKNEDFEIMSGKMASHKIYGIENIYELKEEIIIA